MKVSSVSLVLCAVVLLGAAEISTKSKEDRLSANGLVDSMLARIRKMIVNKGYEPMQLPDYEISILHMGLIGKLKLTECELHNLSTMNRSQDVIYNKVDSGINVKTGVSFTNIQINCDYKVSLLTILQLRKGEVIVGLPNLSAELDMDIQILKMKAHVNTLSLNHNGFIDVHLEGGILEGLASILTEAVSNLLKGVILNQVEIQLKDEINGILDEKHAVEV